MKTFDMADTNRSEITSHMMEKEASLALAQRKNESKQKSANKKHDHDGKRKQRSGNNSSYKGRKGAYKSNKDGNKSGTKGSDCVGPPKDDEPCRLHPYSKHNLIDCNQHPRNAGKSPFKKAKKTASSEDGHVVDEPTDRTIIAQPTEVSELMIDMVGSGKPFSINAPTAMFDESHHLECFALYIIDQMDAQPLTQSLPMSTMETSNKRSVCSQKRIPLQLSSSGPMDTSAKRLEQEQEQRRFSSSRNCLRMSQQMNNAIVAVVVIKIINKILTWTQLLLRC